MKRVNLVLDDSLYEAIKKEADRRLIPVSALIAGTLKGAFTKDRGDYVALTEDIVSMIRLLPPGTSFTMRSFLSAKDVSDMAKATSSTDKSVRSRIGRSMKEAIASGKAGNVKVMLKNGKPMKENGATVYMKL